MSEQDEVICCARHKDTGALCELRYGHKQNHWGAHAHGSVQWPYEQPTQPSLTPADLIALRDEMRGAVHWADAEMGFLRIEGWADQLDTLITRLGEKTSATDAK